MHAILVRAACSLKMQKYWAHRDGNALTPRKGKICSGQRRQVADVAEAAHGIETGII